MKRENPPGVAKWILEHLVPGKTNDALAGDLLEEFRCGRSTLWYWRQVLSAFVVGCTRELRASWLAFVFAFVWAIPAPVLDIFVLRKIGMMKFFAQRWDLSWPFSTICDFGLTITWYLLYISAGVLFYFLVISIATRHINLRRLARALWISSLVYIAAFAVVMSYMAVFPFHGSLIDIRQVTPLSSMALWFVWLRVPVFVALVAVLSGLRRENTREAVAG
jgi:hypothetical protein